MSLLSCLSPRKTHADPPPTFPATPAHPGQHARRAFTAGILAALKTAALAQGYDAYGPEGRASVADMVDELSCIPVPEGDTPGELQDIVASQLADMPAMDRRVLASWYTRHNQELATQLRNRVAAAQAAALRSSQDSQLALRPIYAVSIQLKAIGNALADLADRDIRDAGRPLSLARYEDALRNFLKGVAGCCGGSVSHTALSELLGTVVALGGASRALSEADQVAYHDVMARILAECDASTLKTIAESAALPFNGSMAEVPAEQRASGFGMVAATDVYAARELSKLKAIADARLRADAYVRGTLATLCEAVFANAEVATREEAYDAYVAFLPPRRTSAQRLVAAKAPRAERVEKVVQALYALPPPDRAMIPSVETIVAKQLADMPPTLRRMLDSWFARYAPDMVERLEAEPSGQPGPSGEASSRWSDTLRPRDAACVHLTAVRSALKSMAERDYRAATGPFNMAAYQRALRDLLAGMVAPPNGSVDPFALARLVDKFVASGIVTRKPDETVRHACRRAMEDVLAELQPSELKAVLASFHFTERDNGTRAPAVLGTFISNDSYAAAELLSLQNCVTELAREHDDGGPISTKHFKLYFERRAARSIPLLDRLVAGARDLAGGRGAGTLMDVQWAIRGLNTARTYLQAPLLSEECILEFHKLQSDLGTLLMHCEDTLAKLEPPDMALRLGDAVMYRCNEMLTIAKREAPGSDAELRRRQAEMARSVRCMVEELNSVRTTLHQQALAWLERAQDALLDLDHWLGRVDRPRTAAPERDDVPSMIDRMIDDIRVVSDVALAGWRSDRLRVLRESLAAMLGKGSHLLSDKQLARLAPCGGLGLPMTHVCHLARRINAALLASMGPQLPSHLATNMRAVANSVLAMHRHLAGVSDLVVAPALDRGSEDELISAVQAHANHAVRRMLNDTISRLTPRQRVALGKRLAEPDHDACRQIIRRLPPALSDIKPGGAVGGFAHRFVIEGFRAGISLWAAAFNHLEEAVRDHSVGKSAHPHVVPTPKQWNAAYDVIGTAVGVKAQPAEDGIAIMALENAEFYVLRGDMPKRAVLSDYTLSGRPFKVCRNTATNPRTLSRGSVEVRFPGTVTASGAPESVIVNEQLWTDIHRARFVVDDITLTGKSFPSEESLDVIQGKGKQHFVVSQNPLVYQFLTRLQTICGKENWQFAEQFERQFNSVTALLSQALAASMLSVTMGGEVGYGWFGRGAFVKRHGDTDIEYRCGRTQSGVVRIDLEQNEVVTMIAPKTEARRRQASLELAREYSVARYQMAVEVANGKPNVPANAAKLKFALVEA